MIIIATREVAEQRVAQKASSILKLYILQIM